MKILPIATGLEELLAHWTSNGLKENDFNKFMKNTKCRKNKQTKLAAWLKGMCRIARLVRAVNVAFFVVVLIHLVFKIYTVSFTKGSLERQQKSEMTCDNELLLFH